MRFTLLDSHNTRTKPAALIDNTGLDRLAKRRRANELLRRLLPDQLLVAVRKDHSDFIQLFTSTTYGLRSYDRYWIRVLRTILWVVSIVFHRFFVLWTRTNRRDTIVEKIQAITGHFVGHVTL